MKRFHVFGAVVLASLCLVSCGGPKYLAVYSPEEGGLNVMKISDDVTSAVYGPDFGSYNRFSQVDNGMGTCSALNFSWSSNRLLAISPDGTELAYLSKVGGQMNIMVRRAASQGVSTQRTFRNVWDFSWGNDGKLYYGDYIDNNRVQIGATNAHAGTLMSQVTSNNFDTNPMLSPDGKMLFFTRTDPSGTYIWSYEITGGAYTSCARGFNPYPVDSESFVCARASSTGCTEIWLVNYVKGQETLILSDKNRGFSNPVVSPDGKWIVCQGSSKSSITKKNNLDLFVVRLDGTGFTQLTYHPAHDACPVWAADGKSIFFLSSRAHEKGAWNIWKIKFDL